MSLYKIGIGFIRVGVVKRHLIVCYHMYFMIQPTQHRKDKRFGGSMFGNRIYVLTNEIHSRTKQRNSSVGKEGL